MDRTPARALIIAALYAAAWAGAAALVELRYRWIDPADAMASSGMYAFGDLMGTIAVGGLFSLAPTLLLFRWVRGSERTWSGLSWLLLLWAAPVPPLALLGAWSALSRPGPGDAPSAILQVGGALAFVRLLFTPGTMVVALLAWWLGPFPASSRRALKAAALEACGLALILAWAARTAVSLLS